MKRNRVLRVCLSTVVILSVLMMSCRQGAPVEKSKPGAVSREKQEYVWLSNYVSLPYFVHNDHKGLDAAARELGVTVRKSGPQNDDIPAAIAALEAEIAKKPKGIAVSGWDPSFQVAIDKAMAAGIPVVTVDMDIPDSKRLAYVGSDWYSIGRLLAKQLFDAANGKRGTMAKIGMKTAPYCLEEERGFRAAMNELNPAIKVLGTFDSEHNPQRVSQITTDLINKYKDLIGVVGFDSISPPGIATAIRETGKKGTMWGNGLGNEMENYQGVKDGYLCATLFPNAKIRTYYSIKILYDYNQKPVSYSSDDKKYGISDIPTFIDCGVVVVDKNNVDVMIEAKLADAKE